ncbi:hypothetical protein F5050DRAFT_324485 [Lentinula boryana]|uniref:DUF6533 domain-containing protein n=1 Tax=Lentinula boryana TaxID=40481 RepID=A0ABQ8Q9Z2_9AGAR|nr:hypothetical protein F5050DRAFT_324485 [Lentinula boryana]
MDLDLIGDMTEVRDTNYVAIIGFTIMVWDHVDTFTTEVEYVWPRVGEKKPIVYLFLIVSTQVDDSFHCRLNKYLQNRYLIPLGFIFNLVAYFDIDPEVDV